jgi:predicted transport protein
VNSAVILLKQSAYMAFQLSSKLVKIEIFAQKFRLVQGVSFVDREDKERMLEKLD